MNLSKLQKREESISKRAKRVMRAITKENLVDEMTEIAAQLSYFGERKADALYLMDCAYNHMKAIKAEVGKRIRTKVSVKGTGSPAEKEVEHRLESHPKVIEVVGKHAEAKWKHELISSYVFSLNKKSDQLGNLSYVWMKEMDLGKMQLFGKNINNKFTKKRRRK